MNHQRIEFGCNPPKLSKADTRRLEDYLSPGEWLVLTDNEADECAKGEILSNLWAFRPSFLAGETGIPESVFTAIASNNKCEDNNEAVVAIVKATCGKDALAQAAIDADGRGHFLASYDSKEREFRTGRGVTLFCYRVN